MEQDRKREIQQAYHTLVAHNLWRRGKTDDSGFTPAEIGEAIDTLCGASLDYIALESGNRITVAAAQLCECINRELQSENRRLKALLASHHIRYRKK